MGDLASALEGKDFGGIKFSSEPPIPQTEKKEEENNGGDAANGAANQTTATEATTTATEQTNKEVDLTSPDVVKKLSEMLGSDFDSLDAIKSALNKEPQKVEAQVPESIKPILDFVNQTKRNPSDWFKYQSINPSEMEDEQAVKYGIKLENPDLTPKQIDLLFKNKYKLDSEEFSEDEVELSQIQLKQDARKVKGEIDKLRNSYMTPVASEDESPFDEDWVSSMKENANTLEAIEFDLPDGKKFSFGIDKEYKPKLIEANSEMDKFFDRYVGKDGNWNFELLNVHRAIIDNAANIVTNAYKQGMSDGQKGVVTEAANVSTRTEASAVEQNSGANESILKAVRELTGQTGGMSIK